VFEIDATLKPVPAAPEFSNTFSRVWVLEKFSHPRLLFVWYAIRSIPMSKKLYVGNLSYDTGSEQLKELFAKHGEVTEVAIITDRDTGRSKGFGFVTMATDEGASTAIQRLNGSTYENRSMTVNEARPREERPSSGGYRNNRY
jgi:RNA recognition motif-containing protein